MARKRILVDVEANQWAALKGQAAVEGRFVRVLLGEAIGAYLAKAGAPQSREIELRKSPPVSVTEPTTMRELQTLVAAAVPEARTETAQERLRRITERQEYLRNHPEEEGQ